VCRKRWISSEWGGYPNDYKKHGVKQSFTRQHPTVVNKVKKVECGVGFEYLTNPRRMPGYVPGGRLRGAKRKLS
jgi:hypothetical protein